MLSFDCPLRFIFSHSALKEGWDNPNVFQVCTLLEQKSTFTCRQKVGRGLRLCVKQEGERIEDRNINVLHVMANESFAEFADTLQKEIEDQTGVKFGTLQLSTLIDLTYQEQIEVEHKMEEFEAAIAYSALRGEGIIDNEGKLKAGIESNLDTIEFSNISEPLQKEIKKQIKQKTTEPMTFEKFKTIKYKEIKVEEKSFTQEEAEELYEDLKDKKIISKDGKVKDTMKAQLAAGKLVLKKCYSNSAKMAIIEALEKADNRPLLLDAGKEVTVRLKKQSIISPEFIELWNKIKQKTTYRVNFDIEELVKNCVKDLKEMPYIPKAKIVSQIADLQIENPGISYTEKYSKSLQISSTYSYIPDILRRISSETLLKHSTIIKILEESE